MNSDVIRLLPDSVANQIAAGEVIQRPASVIKELVENAIDAGATEVTIILRDAGRTLIQVVDNGCGMSPTDARMAFERHATSKIQNATDLFALSTMGFRGEALASIAAVAQIDMRTMRHGDTVGTRILISESKFESQEPEACVPGTNLMVKNIFFHMPARRKFLKKDSIELNHILREFERLALVNTNVGFTLIHNDVTLHKFSASPLKQRISALFGKGMESQLVHIGTETSLVKIDGFIALPRFARKRGYQQFLFVNGRNMRHPFFSKAILKCYEQLIPVDAQPSFFIYFTVDPSTIDVNIHPQKHEIKFEHEQAIWQILTAAVKEVLGKNQAAGALDFDSDEAFEIPLFNPDTALDVPFDDAEAESSGNYSPFRAASDNAFSSGYSGGYRASGTNSNSAPRDWDKLYDNFTQKRDDALDQASAMKFDDSAAIATPAPTCFQLQSRYIVTGTQNGLILINQHRAHVRILFDGYLAQLSAGEISSQKVLFPEEFELSPAQNASLSALRDTFESLGFEMRDNGNMRWSILAIPAAIRNQSATEVVLELLEDIADDQVPSPEALYTPLALIMARAAAIKPHQTLSRQEMESITADLFRSPDSVFTPDGLPITANISNDFISSLFSH